MLKKTGEGVCCHANKTEWRDGDKYCSLSFFILSSFLHISDPYVRFLWNLQLQKQFGIHAVRLSSAFSWSGFEYAIWKWNSGYFYRLIICYLSWRCICMCAQVFFTCMHKYTGNPHYFSFWLCLSVCSYCTCMRGTRHARAHLHKRIWSKCHDILPHIDLVHYSWSERLMPELNKQTESISVGTLSFSKYLHKLHACIVKIPVMAGPIFFVRHFKALMKSCREAPRPSLFGLE